MLILNKQRKKIKHQLQVIEQAINSESNDELFALYIYLHKVRHDLLHYLILESLGRSWQEESPLSNFFSDLSIEHGRKTPDIVLLRDNVWYIIDVSVSIDIAKNEQKKTLKYFPIVEQINFNKIKCEYLHINLTQDYSNYQREINKLIHLQKIDFDSKTLFWSTKLIEDKKAWVHKHIDKEFFDKTKADYYKDKVGTKDIGGKQEILLKQLKYENIGEYTDLNIDQKLFQDFNSNFVFVNKIEESYNEKNRREFSGVFKKYFE